ncbi:hypothetical protein ACOMHN_033200 [Nucella lapillus]
MQPPLVFCFTFSTLLAPTQRFQRHLSAVCVQLSRVEFLKNLYDGKAITASEDRREKEATDVDKTCPSSLTTDSSLSVADRSLCPYYFNVLRLPEGYYPSSLNTVRCKCQRCVQHTAGTAGYTVRLCPPLSPSSSRWAFSRACRNTRRRSSTSTPPAHALTA